MRKEALEKGSWEKEMEARRVAEERARLQQRAYQEALERTRRETHAQTETATDTLSKIDEKRGVKINQIFYKVAQLPLVLFLTITALSILGYPLSSLYGVQGICAILTGIHYIFMLLRLFTNEKISLIIPVALADVFRFLLVVPILLLGLTSILSLPMPLLFFLGIGLLSIAFYMGLMTMISSSDEAEKILSDFPFSVFPLTVFYVFIGLAILVNFRPLDYIVAIVAIITDLVIVGELYSSAFFARK